VTVATALVRRQAGGWAAGTFSVFRRLKQKHHLCDVTNYIHTAYEVVCVLRTDTVLLNRICLTDKTTVRLQPMIA